MQQPTRTMETQGFESRTTPQGTHVEDPKRQRNRRSPINVPMVLGETMQSVPSARTGLLSFQTVTTPAATPFSDTALAHGHVPEGTPNQSDNVNNVAVVFLAAVVYHAYVGWAIRKTWWRSNDWCHGARFLVVVTVLLYAGLAAVVSYRYMSKAFAVHTDMLSLTIQENPAITSRIWFLLTVLAFLHSIVQARLNLHALLSVVGAVALVFAAFAFSYNRSWVQWNAVLRCISLHYGLSIILFNWEYSVELIDCAVTKVVEFMQLPRNGSVSIFEFVASGIDISQHVGDIARTTNNTSVPPVLGIQIICYYFFAGTLIRLVYWYEWSTHIVLMLGHCCHIATGATICECIAAMANMFFPSSLTFMVLEPFINAMTVAELFTTMTLGFSTMTAYLIEHYAKLSGESTHVENSMALSVLAVFIYARIVYPEPYRISVTATRFPSAKRYENSVFEAGCQGAVLGLRMASLLLAMIVSGTFLVRMTNDFFAWTCENIGLYNMSLEFVVGKMLIPVAFLLGVEWRDCGTVGFIIATKIIINERAAFGLLSKAISETLAHRSAVLTTYAICSFGNIVESANVVGALEIVRRRRLQDTLGLVMPSLATSCAVSLYNACIAGIFTTTQTTTTTNGKEEEMSFH
ncbi:uncharacterized transporter YutK-like [Ornithodoros turicata]|uniref:uncharacterized transporter YutK-like n=1 Tax=Ornithodoros turicata TaxID=34597 RepID=UPI003139F43D